MPSGRKNSASRLGLAACAAFSSTAAAQSPEGALRRVVITGSANDQQRWTAHASIDVVDGGGAAGGATAGETAPGRNWLAGVELVRSF